MKLLLSLCFCVIFCVTSGQINGDPAPGRSPGPPEIDARVSQQHDNVIDADTVRSKNDSSTGKSSRITTKQSAIRSNLNRTVGNISNNDVMQPDDMDTMSVSFEAKPFRASVDEVTEPTVRPQPLSQLGVDATISDGIPRRCNNARSYLLQTDKIIRVPVDATDAPRQWTGPIRLDVTHDLFDTQPGLVNRIVYTVQASITPGAVNDFYVESLVNDVAKGTFIDPISSYQLQSHSSSAAGPDIKWNQASTDASSTGDGASGTRDKGNSFFAMNVAKSATKKSPSPTTETWEDDDDGDVKVDNIDNEQWSMENVHATVVGVGGDDVQHKDRHVNKINNKSKRKFGVGGEAEDEASVIKSVSDEDRMKWKVDGESGLSDGGDSTILCYSKNVWSERRVHSVNRQMKWFIDETNLRNKTVKFRILYRKNTISAVFETIYIHNILEDCNLSLTHPSASLDFTNMPLFNNYDNCTVLFPSRRRDTQSTVGSGTAGAVELPAAGLLVQLTRLNVPCINGGYISFSDHYFLCGKLEDLTSSERTQYFPTHTNTTVRLHRHPLFRLTYKLVDYCYNVTLTERNSSYFVHPRSSLECYFRIHLPYGYRIELNLIANDINVNKNQYDSDRLEHSNNAFIEPEFLDLHVPVSEATTMKTKHCMDGIHVRLDDVSHADSDDGDWQHCISPFSGPRKFNVISTGNTMVLRVTRTVAQHHLLGDGASAVDRSVSLYFDYTALPITQLVSQCAFGWVAVQQLCLTAIEVALPWYYAETECKKRGGHLAAVRSEREQRVIDLMLLNSSGYKDNSAYWIGASDKNFEGDFAWSNGFPFTYSNWFPGWSEHNNYNKQPNDDGLSGQDCVEIRRFFRAPPGTQTSSNMLPLAPTYMWNDRDCNAKNYFLCERPMSDEPLEKMDWATGCNKTVFLTRDRPRASLWSPGFPRHYPDNTNCFTVVIAPPGYNIVLEFEELVLENEPDCSYDFLEIIDSKVDEPISQVSTIKDLYRKYLHRRRSKRNVRATNKNKPAQYNSYNEVVYNSVETTANDSNVNFFENFLNIYKPHSTVVLQVPTSSNGNGDAFLAAKALPHRVCGDWSSKLKLLRYVTSDSMLGLHFTSDYSHHFGGYKAKVTIKNASSECPDERLKPYNGTCYLFVSYPEVDWQTAQSVCRGIGAQLASVASADEQRFIIGNIRNQLDYSPQATYWLGGELAQSKEFEWTDGTDMTFLGWLPGQEVIDHMPTDRTCLGLQWKMSPTPMLPSGLYWTSHKCTKYGGYICKNKKQKIRETYVQNKTISGTEGRLTSPGYPNTYPLNIDYWVRIIGPARTRLIIQFQAIDLEQQNECLYDYVSVQEATAEPDTEDYEPGTNVHPIAMLTDSVESYQNDYGSADPTDFDANNSDQTQIAHDASAKNWFRQDLQRIRLNIQNSSIFKRDLRYFKKLQNVLRTEGDLQHEIRLLEGLRSQLLTTQQQLHAHGARHKRYMPNQHVYQTVPGNDPSFSPYVRWCGSHSANMSRFDFVSSQNGALLHFHSDYSLSGMGYSFVWSAIDVSGCPSQTLTAHTGSLSSPNYPHFLLNNLDCAYVIQAGSGKRVWLEFGDFETGDDSLVEVDLGTGAFTPFWQRKQLNDGIFVSRGDRIVVRLRTGSAPKGRGFQAVYRTMSTLIEDHSLVLSSASYGQLYHLNYPQFLPNNVNFTQHLVAPLGHVVLLEIYGVGFSENRCHGGGSLEIYDNYADSNGTYWHLCQIPMPFDVETAASQNMQQTHLNSMNTADSESSQIQQQQQQLPQWMRPSSPVHITSYLNTLHVRQITETGTSGVQLNATIRVQPDLNYKYKLASASDEVESCQPNPCQFGGKCIAKGTVRRCQCIGHYTGRFCGLNMCEVEPCLFGKCELTSSGFKCLCQQGYIGRTCDQKQKPCASNPCEGRGECFNKNGGFFCRCHAWWEGQRCEKRMARIPYKPLSDRMLQEPFWLGLITVFVVLAFIGLVWCAKRHFPEKIEKLLAEEAERNRPPGLPHGHHHHHQSLREQLQFTNSVPQSNATTPGAPRTIFGRLGIRKPSILSLSSPQPPGGATARTFSLDDLLRPPPRRTPSPRKKRNNSTPTKKNAAEKKQILQQLISPAANQTRPKVSLDELIQMSENRLKPRAIDSDNDIRETTFSDHSATGGASTSSKGGAGQPLLGDGKLEKKVTFARLLNKVSAEMSSGSETTHTESAISLPVEMTLRTAHSVPPSPCGHHDARSPHSTSSNQGSDSLSSSDLMLPDMETRCHNNRRLHPKVSSADSILTMFRNFASTNVSPQMPTSLIISPSSSPTASSPQDDVVGDDESSTSSLHTPVSYTSGGGVGAPDSPVYYRQSTIEVPVLDLLNTQKTNQTNQSSYLNPPTILLEIPSSINKCLSPIREMPTPMPSPALTPIMSRPQRYSRFCTSRNNISTSFSDDEEKLSIEHYENQRPRECTLNTDNGESEDSTGLPNRHSTKRLRLEVRPTVEIDLEPPSPADRSPNRPTQLIIPQLVVEQASPIKERLPIMYPGSPPPQRQSVGETNFFGAQQKQRRLLKQSDKPASLDLPFIPPMITVTANMSEAESDADLLSPSVVSKNGSGHHLTVPNSGMCYLSPFSICTRGDRTISESNLSSSGYSSMASPGPSRCGSSNPLCPNEMDDPGTGGSGSHHMALHSMSLRRHAKALKTCQKAANGGATATDASDHRQRSRSRSDSETLSDDVLLESNDEGIGTDHLDEKIDDGEIKSAKELEIYMVKEMAECEKFLLKEEPLPTPQLPLSSQATAVVMAQLQLPLIVIQSDGTDKGMSPVSSRSESPLSERTHGGIGRFSPLFYGRKDLPFTDSDGLYDFPSSDGKGCSTSTHNSKKSSTKRRDRKSSRAGITQSPTKSPSQLEIPTKESYASRLNYSQHHPKNHHHHPHYHSPISTVRKSPKRRSTNRPPVASSSSSSESIVSAREMLSRPNKSFFSIQLKDCDPLTASGGDMTTFNNDEQLEDDAAILPKTMNNENVAKPTRKFNKLRAIGNQIRFLRRLEKSIQKRDATAAMLSMSTDSCCCHDGDNDDDDDDDDDDRNDVGLGEDDAEVICVSDGEQDSPGATSPLLIRTASNKISASAATPSSSSSMATPLLKHTATSRQKRLANFYATNIPWRSRERQTIHGGEINSD